jgi:hypothetical protein
MSLARLRFHSTKIYSEFGRLINKEKKRNLGRRIWLNITILVLKKTYLLYVTLCGREAP